MSSSLDSSTSVRQYRRAGVLCSRANTGAERDEAAVKFEKLIEALSSAGLATEVRNGENHSLLVFIKVAAEEHLYGEVYRSR